MLALDVHLQRHNFDLLANLTLDAPVTGLFGSSGSGKSTLLNIVAGLVRPQRGWLTLRDRALFDSAKGIHIAPNNRGIGIVFQDSQLFPHMTVQKNLLYGYQRTGLRERRFRPDDIIDLLEIGHLLSSRPFQLSGGEKQRVGLGRALLASPHLLLLDEPLAALDQGLKEQILPFLKRVKNELALSMFYISHSMDEILHLTDQLVVINQGRILGQGHFYDVLRQKQVQGIAHNLGLDNVLKVTVARHDPVSGHTWGQLNQHKLLMPYTAHLPVGKTAYASVRSNEIAVSRQPIEGISIQNQIEGQLICFEKQAARVTLSIDIGVAVAVDISPKACSDLALNVGDTVYCLIKSQSFGVLSRIPD